MHTAAYFQTGLASGTASDLPAVFDQVLTISNNHFLLQQPRQLLWAYSSGLNLQNSSIQSPTIRKVTKIGIDPFNQAVLPATNPNVLDLTKQPFVLPYLEELQNIVSDNTGTTDTVYTVFTTTSSIVPAPAGNIFTFHGVSSTAAVQGKWTTVIPVWDTILPQGTFAVVGGRMQSTNGIAFRVLFHGVTDRPGGLAETALGNRPPYFQRNGFLGEWGRFSATTLPYIDILANAADASQDISLDIIQVG